MASPLISQALQFRLDDDPKIAICERVKDHLDSLTLGGADLLVGVWEPDKDARTTGGLWVPDTVRKEYQYQGVTGLILKIGPHAFQTEKTSHWFVDADGEPDPPKVGDWIFYNFQQGTQFMLAKQACRLVQDQYVMMRIPRPDLIA